MSSIKWFSMLNQLLHKELVEVSNLLKKMPEQVYYIEKGLRDTKEQIKYFREKFKSEPEKLQAELDKFPFDETMLKQLETQFNGLQKFVEELWKSEELMTKQLAAQKNSSNNKQEKKEESKNNQTTEINQNSEEAASQKYEYKPPKQKPIPYDLEFKAMKLCEIFNVNQEKHDHEHVQIENIDEKLQKLSQRTNLADKK